jgi:integrase
MRIDRVVKYIPIRKSFPKVYRYQKAGNDYFLVDGRSKTWNLNIRKNFNFKEDALNYANEIEGQILENGKAVSNNEVYHDKEIERLVAKLRPFGKTLPQAVDSYIQSLQEEMKKSVVPPIKDLCLKWYNTKCESKSKPLSPTTKNALKTYWKYITNKLGKYKPSEVTHEMIDRLVESVASGESNATRKHYLRHLRMFFNWCIKQRLLRENPTVGIQVVIKRKEIEIYPPDEIERLLRLCETKYPSLLGFYCLTIFGGLRPSEAERVEWSDLNFEGKEVYVKPLGKTGARRFVLKDTETLWVWLKHIKSKFLKEPLNPAKNHDNLQKKLRSEFGVWIQDGLRHSFGTYYHNLIRSIPEVVYVMGNSLGIAKRHYVREVSKEWMEKFWALKPSE